MKDIFLNAGVFYEQLALDYFLAHIFLEEDFFYRELLYMEKISGDGWEFDPKDFDIISAPEGYQKDESVTILREEKTLLVDPKPSRIRITEQSNLVEEHADNIDLEVFTRIMLNNGHYMVMIELQGYRFYRMFYLEINPGNNTIVKWFDRGASF